MLRQDRASNPGSERSDPVRRRQAVVAALLLSALLWGAGWCAQRVLRGVTGPVGPRLQLPDCPQMDLGEGAPGQTVSQTFPLTNIGSQPLEFSVSSSSCACASLSPEEGTIPPGGAVKVAVGIRLERRGSSRQIQFKVATNDPNTPEHTVTASAACPELFSLSTPSISFGDVGVGEPAERRLVIRHPRGEVLGEIRYRSLDAALSVEEIESSRDELTLAVRLGNHTRSGHFRAAVEVWRSGADERMLVPVHAYV